MKVRYLILTTVLFFLAINLDLNAKEIFSADKWLEISTNYCTFIFKAKNKAEAEFLSSFADDIFVKLASYFSAPRTSVRIILLSDIDEANGMFVPYPAHLVLYLRSPISPLFEGRSENWLKLVFIHELAHFFDLTEQRGFFYNLSLIFGQGYASFIWGFEPAWMIEGIAVFFETELSSGGRGRNPFFHMLAKACILEDLPLTLAHLEYYSAYPPPSRYYLFGYFFMNYLKEKYGIEIFKKIRERFLDFPLCGPWETFKHVTGLSADELWAEMKLSLRQKYKAAEDYQSVFFSPSEIADYFSIRVSSRGYFVYRQRLDKSPAIVFIDPQTGEEKIIVETFLTDERSFTISADGSKLIFSAIQSYQPNFIQQSACADLYLINLSYDSLGSPKVQNRQKLTTGGHLWHPALSGDGNKLIAVQGRGIYSCLVEVDLTNGECKTIFNLENTNVFNPVFSPSGGKIALVVNHDGSQALYLLEEKMGSYSNRPIISTTEFCVYFPQFLDESNLLFSADMHEELCLYKYQLTENKISLLVKDKIAAYDGIASSQGIIYASFSRNGYCLKLLTWPKINEKEFSISKKLKEFSPENPLTPADNFLTREYTDRLELLYWFFTLGLLNITDTTYLGTGVYLELGSLFNTSAANASFIFYPSLNQAQFNAEYFLQTKVFVWRLSTMHDYNYFKTSDGEFYQEVLQFDSIFIFPLVYSSLHNYSDYLSLFSGLSYTMLWQASEVLSFLEGLSNPTIPFGMFLDFLCGLNYQHSYYAGPAAFFQPWTLKFFLQFIVPLPVFYAGYQGLIGYSFFSYSLPGLWNLSVLKLGLKSSLGLGVYKNALLLRPRGGFAANETTGTQRILLALDYQSTLFYLDAPLLAGLHLNGLGSGIFIELIGDLDYYLSQFNLQPYIYCGLEFILLGGLGQITLPFGFGVALRFAFQPTHIFDPTKDLAFFFSLSFDSFATTLKNNRFYPLIAK